MRIYDLVTSFTTWLEDTHKAVVSGAGTRSWCNLGFTEALSLEKMRRFFDRSELNKDYEARRKPKAGEAKRPHAYVQAEVHLIYGFHKSFVHRHKTRLQCYKDDCLQKGFNVQSSVNIGYAKFAVESSWYNDQKSTVNQNIA